MAEQTFRSPGFFEQEIDLAPRKQGPQGVPAGVIGTAEKGPAFVPVTVGSFADFQTKFGSLSGDRYAPYAVREFLKHKTALTFMRVLGAGSVDTSAEITTIENTGAATNAGFVVGPTQVSVDAFSSTGRHAGAVQFLCAQHYVSASEVVGFPIFTDNNSTNISAAGQVNLVRAVLLTPTGSRFMVTDHNKYVNSGSLPEGDSGAEGYTYADPGNIDDFATIQDGASTHAMYKKFKLILSSSSGQTFGTDEGVAGIQIFTASLDPSDTNYVGKILNTDPWKFQEKEHLLYLDFAVEDELATVSNMSGSIAICSGSANTSSGNPTTQAYLTAFGRFDSRYTTPRTTEIISQPFGTAEFGLFYFETLSDGAYGNDKYKISIANLRASTDPKNDFPTFDVQVRNFEDTDMNKQVIEEFPQCTLNPNSDSFVAAKVGDYKLAYDFDQETEAERRLVISGKYPNRSQFVRVVINQKVYDGEVPDSAMPFGFRGIPVLKTTNTLSDSHTALTVDGVVHGDAETIGVRLTATQGEGLHGRPATAGLSTPAWGAFAANVTGSIIPPLPFRFKQTRGAVSSTSAWVGNTGGSEKVDSRYYWGVKTTRTAKTASLASATLQVNAGSLINPLVRAYGKFQGITKMDNLLTGSGADQFNNNKFSLSKVALYNNNVSQVTGTAGEHMLEAAYIRNAVPDGKYYKVSDNGAGHERITLASLVNSSSTIFNRFSDYAKFTTIFYGGHDGLNILDKDNHLMSDRATSSDLGGLAGSSTPNIGLSSHVGGSGVDNNSVFSFKTAISMMTDPTVTRINILAIPGMRDAFITDHAADATRTYSKAIYLMDLLHYGETGPGSNARLYDDSKYTDGPIVKDAKADARETSESFDSRALDNNYVAAYFPDVYIEDPINNLRLRVPSSVVALGALAYNDRVAYPWFAPAGFNRGALDFVTNVDVRLSQGDRDTLYDARINPIATFPQGGFVIFGQKTLQMSKSALDRVNVRRMLLEVKRLVVGVANKILFEQNTPATRAKFINSVTPLLALVQAQAGIEKFKVVMDDTNNTEEDRNNNRLNGRIVVVPTRAIEFIAIDFIIDTTGVSFQ